MVWRGKNGWGDVLLTLAMAMSSFVGSLMVLIFWVCVKIGEIEIKGKPPK